MTKLLNVAVLGLFLGATSLVGCKVSGEIDGDDDGGSKTTVKKTTVEPDGDKKVTKETKSY